MLIICITRELEEQRYERNKATVVNHTYINGGEYRRKFDNISEDADLNRLLYKLAKKMLEHRLGTLYEDVYWIDLDTMEVVAEETSCIVEEEISYSKKTKKVVNNHDNLLTIHTHPNSYPPSIADFNSNCKNKYMVGIVICHDGTIYMYDSSEIIEDKYYQMTVAEYSNSGYNTNEAQIQALNDIKYKFNIQFKEVTGNDV